MFYCSREQIRIIMELPKASGSIVNIASIASLVHGGDTYGYGVSKAGVAYFVGMSGKGCCTAWDSSQCSLNSDNFNVLAKGT
jgi:hypothetical protein